MEAIHRSSPSMRYPSMNWWRRTIFSLVSFLRIQATVKRILLRRLPLRLLSLPLRWTQRLNIAKHSIKWEGKPSTSSFLDRATPWGSHLPYPLLKIIRPFSSEMMITIAAIMRGSLTMLHRRLDFSPPTLLRRDNGTIVLGLIHSGGAFYLV